MWKRFFSSSKKKQSKLARQTKSVVKAVSLRGESKVYVENLRLGMYVSSLDKHWLETSFKTQGFYINNEMNIDELSKQCRYVYIDLNKSNEYHSVPGGGLVDLQVQHSTQKIPSYSQWKSDVAGYREASALSFSVLDSIVIGDPVAVKKARKLVSSCVDSVLKNPSVSILLSQMQKKSNDLARHSLSCCMLSASFGKFLGMDDNEIELLALGAFLHDVGMLKMMAKDETYLLHCDNVLKKSHVIHGRDVLMSNEALWSAVDVAYSHHERFDGKGYPRSLKGESIPYNARIVAIVDLYESLTSYSKNRMAKLSPTLAISEIYKSRGSRLEKGLVEMYIRFVGLYPLGSLLEVNTGEVGVVIERNPFYKKLPKIVLVIDSKGKKITPKLVDLYKEQDVDGGGLRIVRALPNGSFGIDMDSIIEQGLLDHNPLS